MAARARDYSFARFIVTLLAAFGLLLLVAAPANARPKVLSNGCTGEQLQSAAAGQCIDQMQDDILNNRPTFHAVYCSGVGTMRCCEYDAQTGATIDHSCRLISRANPTIFPPQSLTTSGLVEPGDSYGGSTLVDDGALGGNPTINPGDSGTLY